MISTSDLESWLDGNAKNTSSSAVSRNSNSSFSETTGLILSIKFWNGAFILLHDISTAVSLVLFLRLAQARPSRSPSTTSYSQKCVPSLSSTVVRPIYRFPTASTKLIAARLRLLLHIVWLKLFFKLTTVVVKFRKEIISFLWARPLKFFWYSFKFTIRFYFYTWYPKFYNKTQ